MVEVDNLDGVLVVGLVLTGTLETEEFAFREITFLVAGVGTLVLELGIALT